MTVAMYLGRSLSVTRIAAREGGREGGGIGRDGRSVLCGRPVEILVEL